MCNLFFFLKMCHNFTIKVAVDLAADAISEALERLSGFTSRFASWNE